MNSLNQRAHYLEELISILMIGIVTSLYAMSTMFAPSFNHNRQHSHHFDKKPMPHKAAFHHKGPSKYFSHNDRRDVNRLDDSDHRSFYNKNDRPDHASRYKAPPRHP